MTNNDYFSKQAIELVRCIHANLVSTVEVAACLQCIYSAGVIDSATYSDEDKKAMQIAINKIYKITEN